MLALPAFFIGEIQMETTVNQYLNELDALSHEAQRMAQKQGIDTSTKPHNNEADAFRHT